MKTALELSFTNEIVRRSKRHGFGCFETNHKRGIFAVAENGLNPVVSVFDYKTREEILRITGSESNDFTFC